MSFKKILKYFLIWQVLIVLVVTSAGHFLPLQVSDTFLGAGITNYSKNPLLNFRSNFDGVHYTLIATHGYNYGQQAFFPFYPFLIKLIRFYFSSPVMAGVIISSVSFLFALYFLERLIRLDHPPAVARWTIIALLVFPTSFFFSAVYTESLFFLLVVLSFYLARTGRTLPAYILAALAGYTRLIGIFLLPALFLEGLLQYRGQPLRQQIKKLLPLVIIPMGLLFYMNYLQQTTGEPLLFYRLQSAFKQGRGADIILPYQVLWRYIKMIITVERTNPLYLTVWLEFVTGILFLILSVISLFKQRLSYAVFNLLAFILPTLTGIFTSLPRYVLICFPTFILIGQALSDRPILRRVTLISSSVLWILFLSLFARGYWVA